VHSDRRPRLWQPFTPICRWTEGGLDGRQIQALDDRMKGVLNIALRQDLGLTVEYLRRIRSDEVVPPR